MAWGEDVFERITADPRAVMTERIGDVVSWRWATAFATMQMPEPLFRWRTAYVNADQGQFLDEKPSGEFAMPTQYGFDTDGQIILARGGIRREDSRGVQHGEQALWRSAASAVELTATVGTADGMAITEVVEYEYQDGRMISSATITGYCERRRELKVTRERRWFRYDRDGRLVLVLSVGIGATDAPRALYPRAQRITWGGDGEPVMVASTFGPEGLPQESREDFLSALLQWEPLEHQWSVTYDARQERQEHEFPDLAVLFEGLHRPLADAFVVAVSDARDRGELAHPFLLIVGDPLELKPLWGTTKVIDERARRRRREMADPPADTRFEEAVGLAVVDFLDELTLQRIRQIKQHPARSAMGSELSERLATDLLTELNRRSFDGAAADFIALVQSGQEDLWVSASAVLGPERVEAFRASLRASAPIKLPRGPGTLDGDDSVQRLLRSRGMRDVLVPHVAALAEWGIRLPPGPGSSHLGGLPPLPSDVPWPACDGQPLNFIAAVDLDSLPAVPGRELLPLSGCLLFFFLVDDDMLEPAEAGADREARVIHLSGTGSAINVAAAPLTPYGSKSLIPVPRLTLPTAIATPLPEGLEFDAYDRRSYDKALERAAGMKGEHRAHRYRHQTLGHPISVQNDERLDPGGPHQDRIVLLHVEEDSSIGLELGDGGALTYLMSKKALHERSWSEVWVDAQSG